jgi:hypothetical protein
MHIPDTARDLLRALESPEAPPAIRLRLAGYDHTTLCDLIEVGLDGERGMLQAGGNGYLAALTPLPGACRSIPCAHSSAGSSAATPSAGSRAAL